MPVPSAADDPRGEAFTIADGRTLFLRAIRPDDVAALLRAFARLTPEQVRLRVFHPLRTLAPAAAARLCRLDPTSAVAYVAVDADGEIRGDARFYVEAGDRAEFALIVDPSLVGLGVGHALMQRLLAEARRRGLSQLWGSVLTENATMLDFAQRLGAERVAIADEPDRVRVHFDLGAARADAGH